MSLKPFMINQTDIQFILDQINFVPLFNAEGDIIVAWNGTGSVYDINGALIGTGGQIAGDPASLAAIEAYGASYQNVTDLAGTRDVSGFWNNLSPQLSHYGDTGQIFPRLVLADYLNYLQQATGAPTTGPVVTIVAPETSTETKTETVVFDSGPNSVFFGSGISKTTQEVISTGTDVTVVSGSSTTTQVVDGHHLVRTETTTSTEGTTTTTSFDYVKDVTTTTLTTANGTNSDTSTVIVQTSPAIVELETLSGTPAEVTYSGGELDGNFHGFTTEYALAHQNYAVTTDSSAAAVEGDTQAADHSAINIQNVIDYTPRMISRTTTTAGVTYDTWANHQGDTDAPNHTPNEIYYGPTGEATVLDWGQLETVANGGLGQVDTQARLEASAGQGDHFIGGLNPGVSPSNGFFVLFGQFFDHGLDFIDKGQLDSSGKNVTIKIALAVDDPLYGMTGPDGKPVTEITINRATVQTIDEKGSEYVNHVSPFIDQSQTYGSDVQRTQLLREWVRDTTTASPDDFRAGMKLLDGTTLATQWAKPDGTLTNDTLPTLNELRAHIVATGRDALTWEDLSDLRNRDDAGHVTTGSSGEALLLDMNPRFDAAHLYSSNGFNDTNHDGTLNNGELTQDQVVDGALATLNADLHSNFGSGVNIGMVDGMLTLTGLQGPGSVLTGASALFPWVDFSNFGIMQTNSVLQTTIGTAAHTAVSEILLASVGDHYIAGDGRVNENFGLTSVHHVFHEEHNFQVDNLIDALHRQDVAGNDATHSKLHEFQINTGHGMNAAGDYVDANGQISWDQDKIFQGAKLIVEMEYQHAAVDQYARNVSPNIQEFVGYSPDKLPDVSLEYAQVAFRFGHSTLRETIDTIDPTHGITGKIMGYALHDAFLNPETYSAVGPAAILLGMTHQQMNEVDEFVTPALNQGLLGQPLDLAAINIARGRDIGIPTLNDFREALGLVRYTSWNDFGQNMQHPGSLVNFIAAYSFDGDMNKATAIIGLVDGSIAEGSDAAMGYTAAKALAFLSGDVGNGGDGTLGFNQIDTWLGGLAEIHQPGGLLGETFDLVFVTQIESLMDGDRFYYLYRLAGQQFGEEVANAQLKDIVERNSGLTHLNGNVFGYADQYVELAAKKEVVAQGDEALTTGNEHKYGDNAAVADGTIGIYTNGGPSSANDGNVVTIGGVQYIQDTRLAETDASSAYGQNDFVNLDGTPNSGAESSEVIVGSKGNDLIYAQGGDDTVYGEEGNDTIFGGYGIDRLYGGAGSDTIKGGDNPDLIDGGAGDDFLYGESSGSDINGADQIIGGSGNDVLDGGIGIDKLSAGSGDDRVYGGQDTDPFTHGGDGNDYVDGGSGGDILYGDNGDDVVVGGSDQDQLFGDDGDDILRPGDPTGALTIGGDEVLGGDGSDVNDKGFDLIDFSDNTLRPGGVTFDLSNQQNPGTTPNGSSIQVQSYQIDGVVGSKGDDTLVGDDATAAGAGSDASIAGDNWLVGGSGNDRLSGLGGNDVIVGGSVRLSALIGSYVDANGNASTYDHNNNNDGLTDADQLQDARYQGASHRVGYADHLSGGLLEGAGFDRHFSEMLRTELFKDITLGDGGTDGSSDTAVYTGRLADYTLEALDASGHAVLDPHNHWSDVFAIKITDHGGLNPDGTIRTPTDGIDLLVGVEKVDFSDTQGVGLQAYFDKAPTLDLHHTLVPTVVTAAQDNFSGQQNNAYARGSGWASNWVETNDATNSATSGQVQVANNALRFSTGDGAEITRTLNLAGQPNATISYNVNESNFAAGETVTVRFAADGVNFVTLETITSATNNGGPAHSFNINAPAGGFSSSAVLQLVGSAIAAGTGNNGAHTATFDNFAVTVPGPLVDGFAGNNNSITYTEQQPVAPLIATDPLVGDPDDAVLSSAKIVLRDPVAGDRLDIGAVAAAIVATGNGTGPGGLTNATTITLAGIATLAQYQAALAAITFSNPSNDNPTNADRHIDVTVNDGLKDSAIATTTVHVTPVDDPSVMGADSILTNVGGNNTNTGPTFVIPDWALLRNDSDPDTTLSITSVANVASSLRTVTHTGNSQTVTVGDNATLGGSFTYGVPGGATGTVTVVNQAGAINGTATSEILVGGNNGDTITGGGGNDIVFANGGNDTITTGSGNDYIDGGTGNDVMTGGGGDDTYVIDVGTGTLPNRDQVIEGGNGGTDTVTGGVSLDLGLYANVENATLTGNSNSSLTGSATANVLTGNSGSNTINAQGGSDTILGGQGNDTINAGDGDDFIVWNANNASSNNNNGADGRDIIDGGANGTAQGDTFTVNGNSSSEVYSIYTAAAWLALGGFGNNGHTLQNAGTEIVVTRGTNPANGSVIAELRNIEEIAINTAAGSGSGGNAGGDGDNVIIVGNFATTHLNYNTIHINGGSGNDNVDISGLNSAHRIVFQGAGGDNHVIGDLRPQDVVDGSTTGGAAASAADLGTGGQSSFPHLLNGNDELFSVHHIKGGHHDDVLRATKAVDVLEGGDGHDTFRFNSVTAADGDTIRDFHPGDRIDLSHIDANAGASGNQAFTLVNGSGATHLVIEHETRADGEYTVVSGFTANGAEAAFHINIAGNHQLTDSDFNL
jgi:Ca2+-binding RTX toxin-like protein